MRVGDLVKTHKGNMALITDKGKDWCNIVFVETGNLRTGYPKEWLRRLK